MISKCMSIVNNMAQEDQDSLLEKLESYQAMGIPADKAQRMAASDVHQEILTEEAEFMRLLAEQHPDIADDKPETAKSPADRINQELTNAISKSVDEDFMGIVQRMQKDGVLEVNCE